jgi:membrane-bound inhibitor of C-type lysozyme
MNAFPIVCATLSLALAAGPALADSSPMQPPMNAFAQAFYRCDGGEAFMMSYDSEQPESAEMVTNSDNRHYELKRSTAPNGVRFAGPTAKFWTDGKTVTVESAKASFHNCKMKPS